MGIAGLWEWGRCTCWPGRVRLFPCWEGGWVMGGLLLQYCRQEVPRYL